MPTKNKKAEPTAEETAAALDVFEQQQYTGIVMAQAVARCVFSPEASVDLKLVLRIQGLLKWEENGDPAEDQAEITQLLERARDKAQETCAGGIITPDSVLDLHVMIYEDFFSEE